MSSDNIQVSIAGRGGGTEGRVSILGEAEQCLVDHVGHVVDEHVRADEHTIKCRFT